MIYLLDTHVFLWWLADDAALTEKARRMIADPENVVWVSAASAWEIAIKQALGKLKAPADLEKAIAASHMQTLPMTVSHALAAGRLPRHHEDPFDRMLIAQARHEGLTLLTHDKRLKIYGPSVQIV